MSFNATEILGEDENKFYGRPMGETEIKAYPKSQVDKIFTQEALEEWRKTHSETGPYTLPPGYKPRKKKTVVKIEEEDEKLVEQLKEENQNLSARLQASEKAYTLLELKYQRLEAEHIKLLEESGALIQDGTQHRIRLEQKLQQEHDNYLKLEHQLHETMHDHKEVVTELKKLQQQSSSVDQQRIQKLELEKQEIETKFTQAEQRAKQALEQKEQLRQQLAKPPQLAVLKRAAQPLLIKNKVKPHREQKVKAFLAVVSGVY